MTSAPSGPATTPDPETSTVTPHGVEKRSIEMVPDSERHGKAFSQFTLWFGANLQITAIVNGALAVVFGADALWAIIGVLIGQVVGAGIMALHSIQGPVLGLPQMIGSRAQFGVHGAALPLALVLVLCLGFGATGTVLSGQAINTILGRPERWIGIAIFATITGVIALFGYRVIHGLGRFSSVVGTLGLAYAAFRLFQTHSFTDELANSTFELVPFILAISLGAGWHLTFAPYSGDYSRYLPRDINLRHAWFACFMGALMGGSISMILGIFIATAGQDDFLHNQVGYVGGLASNRALTILLLVTIVIGKLTANTLSAYGGVMAIATAASGFTGTDDFPPAVRNVIVVVFTIAVAGIALWASADFLQAFKNFVLSLLLFFVPWSTINLINFYFHARSHVDIPALYTDRGRYGAVHWPTVAVYLVGVAAQIPFMAQTLYTGPLTKALGGVDISWVVGIVVTAALYFPIGRNAFDYPPTMIYPDHDPRMDHSRG